MLPGACVFSGFLVRHQDRVSRGGHLGVGYRAASGKKCDVTKACSVNFCLYLLSFFGYSLHIYVSLGIFSYLVSHNEPDLVDFQSLSIPRGF